MEKTLLSCGSNSKVMKDCWESTTENDFKYDKDYPYGYPWPPRYYTCTFCQREFRSAQALGGHMNIHRRDRARLRDLSPNNNPFYSSINNNNTDQNPNPNPNPNSNPNPNNPISSFSPSSSPTNNTMATTTYAHQYSLVSLSLSSIPPSTKHGKHHSHQGVEKWKNNVSSIVDDQEVSRVSKNTTTSTNKEVVRLDLELCLGEAKEELDLELRLGV